MSQGVAELGPGLRVGLGVDDVPAGQLSVPGFGELALALDLGRRPLELEEQIGAEGVYLSELDRHHQRDLAIEDRRGVERAELIEHGDPRILTGIAGGLARFADLGGRRRIVVPIGHRRRNGGAGEQAPG